MSNRVVQSILSVLIVVSASSCDQPDTLSANEKARVTEEVKATLTSYYADIRKSGLTAEFNYLDSSANFFWVPPGYSSALSYDSVASIISRNAALYSLVDNSFDTVTIFPVSKELVTYTGRLRSVMTDTSGNTNSFTLIETGVMTKTDNTWKLLCGQTSVLPMERFSRELLPGNIKQNEQY